MKRPLLVFILSGTSMMGGIALAHHGWGSYDASKPFSITSAVQRADWQNPHVTIVVTHANRSWDAVLAPPFRMNARGLEPDMIKPGAQVTVEGYPSAKGENEMRAERITLGGRTFELR